MVARGSIRVVMEGHEYWHDGKGVSIWSAPKYKYRVKNKGAFIEIDDHMQKTVIQYSEAPD